MPSTLYLLSINFLRATECYDDTISGRTVIETITDKTATYQKRTAVRKIILLLPVFPTHTSSKLPSSTNADEIR